MRTLGAGNQLALENAREEGIKPRGFFTIWVKDREDGDLIEFCLWTGDEDINFDVISGETGEAVTRTFVGGINLDYPEIPRVADLTIQTVEVGFTSNANICKQIVLENDCRLARFELHQAWRNSATNLFSDPGEIDFLGIVDEAPSTIPSVNGGDAMYRLKGVSEAIAMLTRTNPAKRSDVQQKNRSGDRWRKYKNGIATWDVRHGAAPAPRGNTSSNDNLLR
jgi:hypothetical protein